MSWDNCSLMAWFSRVMCDNLAWTSPSSWCSCSSSPGSPCAWRRQNLQSLGMCLPLGWPLHGSWHTAHSGSMPDECTASSNSMEHRAPVGIWCPCTGRPQEEQHGMVPASREVNHRNSIDAWCEMLQRAVTKCTEGDGDAAGRTVRQCASLHNFNIC